MHHIPNQRRRPTSRHDLDGDVSRAVAVRGDQADVVIDDEVRRHEVHEPGLGDRGDRVREKTRRRLGLTGDLMPVSPLGVHEYVTRVRERRHPAPVLEVGVPTDVVRVHMRAQDDIHVRGGDTGSCQAIEEVGCQLVEGRDPAAPVLPVADAGVDQDQLLRRPDHDRVDALEEVAVRVLVVRLHPLGAGLCRLAFDALEHPADRGGEGQFLDVADLDGAVWVQVEEVGHRSPPSAPDATPRARS